MGQIWNYSVFLKPDTFDSSYIIDKTLSFFHDHGYSSEHPTLGKHCWFSNDGLSLLNFMSLRELKEHIIFNGGAVQVWKGELEYFVEFMLTKKSNNKHNKNIYKDNEFIEISIGIDDVYFKKSNYGGNCAQDILDLYLKFCLQMNIKYGFVANEDFYDYFGHIKDNIQKALANGELPDVLPWIIYLNDYNKKYVDIKSLEECTKKILEYNNAGIFLFMFDTLPNINIGELIEINKMWTKIRTSLSLRK